MIHFCAQTPSRASTIVFLIVSFAFPATALAFPEMVRHNYVNCTSCHVSPNGGGVLTSYGRDLSREVLSTFGVQNESESNFAYGLVRTPEWLNLMGMYRSVYAYQRTPFVQEGKFIFMQNDLEASVEVKKWYIVAALGYENKPNDVTVVDHLISRRHYVNYRPTDELSFRVGRFFPAFGINTPIHVIPTKRALGWDESQETYNFESAWIGEKWNLFLTLDMGRPDQPSLNREKSVAVSPSVAISDHHKIGASYFYGTDGQTQRHLFGPWAILGFTPHFFLLSEWDFQVSSSIGNGGWATSQFGAVNSQVLDYEFIQGLHFYLTQDFSRLNFSALSSLIYSFGAGIQFFPRPHFELNLSWKKQKAAYVSDTFTDLAWLMLNFYL